jgi:LPXTG-site transpeptidase (sortase) family protein
MDDLQLRPIAGSGGPAWRRWLRRLSVLTGAGVVGLAIFLVVQFMQTPAIELQGPPISQYAATHTATGSLPTVRTGLWILIPDLKVALPIREGDGSNNIPDWAAMHYPGTAEPGQNGNSYLYAHGLWGMFGPLLFAHDGEQVLLHNYTTGASMTFHISRIVGRVRWNDVSWIYEGSSTPLLTLQTCIGADPHTDRWIVQATP